MRHKVININNKIIINDDINDIICISDPFVIKRLLGSRY
jgi:hypothetical protein